MGRPALKLLTTGPREAKGEFVLLCSSGRLKDALRIPFSDVLRSDAGLFAHVFRACHALPLTLPLLRQLHAFATTSGVAVDRFTTNNLMLAYADLGDLPKARMLFDRIPKRNIMSWNILIGGYIKNSDLERARKLFDEMPKRNVATWNAMIAGLANVGLDEDSLRFFLAMRRAGMHPDEFGLGSVFRCCAGLTDVVSGQQVHAYVLRFGLDRNMFVGNSLSHMYMRCGCSAEGEEVLQAIPQSLEGRRMEI